MDKKLLTLIGILTLALAPAVTAQTSVNQLSNGLSSFVNNATASLPFAASAGTDWSNAYIGQLVDTDFPWVHLGVGVTAGATSIPTKAVNPLLESMGQSDVSSLGIPFSVFNIRLGGVYLPFDVGFKIGFLPSALTSANGYSFNYSNLGFDVRYDLVKSDLWLPDVSVGGGLSYMTATVSGSYGNSSSYSDGNGNTLMVSAPNMSLKLSSLEFEAKAQVSKTLVSILTPYLGLTASYGTAHAEASVNANVTTPVGQQPVSYWQKYIPGLSNSGYDQAIDTGVFGMKIYGGTSINIFVVKFDFQAMYSLFDGNYGGSAGIRIQL